MLITFEFGKCLLAPGRFKSTFGGKPYTRIWFGCVAISWTQLDAKEFHDAIASGNTEFRTIK